MVTKKVTPVTSCFTTMEMVILSPESTLSQIVTEAVRRALPYTERKHETLPDRIGVDDVEEETGLSKSTIYKLTMDKKLPCSKFGKQLVFSRKEIRQWLEANTITKDVKGEVGLRLAKRVNKNGGIQK